MTTSELAATLGPQLRKLPAAINFKNSFAYQVADVTLGPVRFVGLFQMDPGRGRLVQVLLRFVNGTPTTADHAQAKAALEAALGAPTKSEREADSSSNIPWFRLVDRWQFPTTTVVLTYFEPNFESTRDKSLTVRYFPTKAGPTAP